MGVAREETNQREAASRWVWLERRPIKGNAANEWVWLEEETNQREAANKWVWLERRPIKGKQLTSGCGNDCFFQRGIYVFFLLILQMVVLIAGGKCAISR